MLINAGLYPDIHPSSIRRKTERGNGLPGGAKTIIDSETAYLI